MLSKNISVVYRHINQTESNGWAASHEMEYRVLLLQLVLASIIILIIVAIFTILGNTLVLLTTWRDGSLHQPSKYFIACLAVADLLVGAIIDPLMLYRYRLHLESKYHPSDHLCRFAVWIDTFALTASIYSLIFISFDRYIKIKKTLQYRHRMTTCKALKIILIIWLISTAFGTYAASPRSGSLGIVHTGSGFCSSNHYASSNKQIGFYTFLAVGAFFLPITVMLVMYALIFVVVHKRQKMLRNGELGQTCNDRNQRSAFLQDLKTIRMLLIVVGVFILCWGPYFILLLLLYYHPYFTIDSRISWSFSDWRRFLIACYVIRPIPYYNSLCNPIIYAWQDQTYRKGFKNLFQRMMCRRSSRRRLPPEAIELRQLRT